MTIAHHGRARPAAADPPLFPPDPVRVSAHRARHAGPGDPGPSTAASSGSRRAEHRVPGQTTHGPGRPQGTRAARASPCSPGGKGRSSRAPGRVRRSSPAPPTAPSPPSTPTTASRPTPHEFVISPQDTALVTAFRPVAASLSRLGGLESQGWRCVAAWSRRSTSPQRPVAVRVEPRTDHVPVTDGTCRQYGRTSRRSRSTTSTSAPRSRCSHRTTTCCCRPGTSRSIYKVGRSTRQVRPAARRETVQLAWVRAQGFWFQHHVLPQGQDTLSIFDDGAPRRSRNRSPAPSYWHLYTGAMRATLQRKLRPSTLAWRTPSGRHAGAGRRPGPGLLGQPAVLLAVHRGRNADPGRPVPTVRDQSYRGLHRGLDRAPHETGPRRRPAESGRVFGRCTPSWSRATVESLDACWPGRRASRRWPGSALGSATAWNGLVRSRSARRDQFFARR